MQIKQTSLRLPHDLWIWLRREQERTGKSINEYVVDALREKQYNAIKEGRE